MPSAVKKIRRTTMKTVSMMRRYSSYHQNEKKKTIAIVSIFRFQS